MLKYCILNMFKCLGFFSTPFSLYQEEHVALQHTQQQKCLSLSLAKTCLHRFAKYRCSLRWVNTLKLGKYHQCNLNSATKCSAVTQIQQHSSIHATTSEAKSSNYPFCLMLQRFLIFVTLTQDSHFESLQEK